MDELLNKKTIVGLGLVVVATLSGASACPEQGQKPEGPLKTYLITPAPGAIEGQPCTRESQEKLDVGSGVNYVCARDISRGLIWKVR